MPGLAARAWHEPAELAACRRLEDLTDDIAHELSRLRRARALGAHPDGAGLAKGGDWRAYFFWREGRRVDDHCRACPRTARALDEAIGDLRAGRAYFSALAPRTHIAPHRGPTNTRIRIHLPLVVPPGATLTVGGETRAYERGRCLVFDDSFEHHADNPGDEWRVVLLVDVWHPELSFDDRERLLPVLWGQPPARAPVGAAYAFFSRPRPA